MNNKRGIVKKPLEIDFFTMIVTIDFFITRKTSKKIKLEIILTEVISLLYF